MSSSPSRRRYEALVREERLLARAIISRDRHNIQQEGIEELESMLDTILKRNHTKSDVLDRTSTRSRHVNNCRNSGSSGGDRAHLIPSMSPVVTDVKGIGNNIDTTLSIKEILTAYRERDQFLEREYHEYSRQLARRKKELKIVEDEVGPALYELSEDHVCKSVLNDIISEEACVQTLAHTLKTDQKILSRYVARYDREKGRSSDAFEDIVRSVGHKELRKIAQSNAESVA